jgi:hypothetical protein
MQDLLAPVAALAAFSLAGVSLGGGLYECVLVDRSWPKNIALIQPDQDGLNRKLFWIPVHIAFEVALAVALWSAWTHGDARNLLFVAAASHLLMRTWSGIYFIPRALEFEGASHLTPNVEARAKVWVRLSVWRLPLDLVSLFAMAAAVSVLLTAE